VGRADPRGVRLAGWVALSLSFVYALCMSALFVTEPRMFLRLFTNDATLLRVGASVLFICAVFQPFDGFQAIATGALRGLGETTTPMLMNLAGHWAIGLPVGFVLCFQRGWGVEGLWTGLAIGLILIGATLIAVWHKRSQATTFH
jgi:MATE family multidrug resistance protein